MDPNPKFRWEFGANVTDAQHAEAIHNKTVFMDWFNSKFLAKVDDPAQCSSSLMIYIGSSGVQNPRNEYFAFGGVPFGFSTSRYSVFAECPDSVFPIGEVGGFSNISNHIEQYPVTVDVMVAKGCDGLLVKLAQDLVTAGILTLPKTGGSVKGAPILM